MRPDRSDSARRQTPRLRALRALLAIALLASLGACSREGGGQRDVDPTLRARALIDSGNASYRHADYQGAAKRYASATLADPTDPAAYYGLGMALSKLGRDDDARQAYAKARELARGSGAPPDSFSH